VLAWFLFILASVFVFCSIKTSAETVQQHVQDVSVIIVDRIEENVGLDSVDIEMDSVCSGFIASSKHGHERIVTAAHCSGIEVSNGPVVSTLEHIPIMVKFSDGDLGKIVDYTFDHDNDILILDVHSRHGHPAAVLTQSYQSGDDFTTYGLSHNLEWVTGRAFASRSSRAHGEEVDGLAGEDLRPLGVVGVMEGNSGSGVFDRHGRVVGIIDGGSVSNPTLAFMVGASHIQHDLNLHGRP
jgi:hypothetical protein